MSAWAGGGGCERSRLEAATPCRRFNRLSHSVCTWQSRADALAAMHRSAHATCYRVPTEAAGRGRRVPAAPRAASGKNEGEQEGQR